MTEPRIRRRGVLAALLGAPIVVVTGRLIATGRLAVPFLRPPSDGSSATRCAQCGSDDHTMLDAGCPASRRVI